MSVVASDAMASHRSLSLSTHLLLLLAAAGTVGLPACTRDGSVNRAPDASTRAPDAGTVSAAPAGDAGTTTTVAIASAQPRAQFHGFFGKSASGPSFWLGLRRRGDAVQGIYRASSSTDFTGRMTDATHFTLRESRVPKGKKPATLDGELASDSALVATITDGRTQKTTQLTSKGDVFEPRSDGFKEEYTGSLGGRFIRMKLDKVGEKVTGVYRYAKSAEDIRLEGTATDKTGAFELTEKVGSRVTGRFAGIFVSKAGILAEWSSPDGERRLPVKLEEGSGYPETVDVGQGMKLYPQENLIEGKRCKEDFVFPQLRGAKDATKQRELNAILAGALGKEKTCAGPDEPELMDYETSESYSLSTHKTGRFVGLTQGGYSYTGGAHGNGASECSVLDMKNLTRIRLAESLTDAGRKELGELTTRALQKQLGVAKLTDSYFYADDVEIQKTTNVCLTDAEIEVSFNAYEIAPYVAGFQSVSFPKADVRGLFEKNELTDAMFSQ